MVETAQRPVVLYGSGLSTTVYAAMRTLPAQARFLPLIEGTNTRGAARLGLSARPVSGEVLYLMAGDDLPDHAAAARTAIHRGPRRLSIRLDRNRRCGFARADVGGKNAAT